MSKMYKESTMEKVKPVQLKRTKERTHNIADLVDHAGELDERIKTLTKQLDVLKNEIKKGYTNDIKEIHGGTYKAVFSERERWAIHPQDWVGWLKKNYNGTKLNELFSATTKVSVGDVRSSLGATVLREVGVQEDSVVALSLKRRD